MNSSIYLRKKVVQSSVVFSVYCILVQNAPQKYSIWFALLVLVCVMLAFLRPLLRSQLASLTAEPETCDRKLLLDAVAGLLAYPAEMKNLAARRRMLFSRLSPRHQRIAGSSGYSKRIRDLDRAVTRNTEITASIAKLAEKQFGVTRAELLHSTRPAAHSRVVELLKHFVRDWSDEGERERSVLMPPILDCIRNEFGLRSGKRILVPGAGVGRLAYEISLLGES